MIATLIAWQLPLLQPIRKQIQAVVMEAAIEAELLS